MMVLSATQTTAFMDYGAHMLILHDTVKQLQNEGIIVAADLINFDNSTINQIAANDLFQPKMDLFSTRALTLVHFKTVHYFS